MLRVKKIHMDYQKNLTGVSKLPQIGWILESSDRNMEQRFCQIQLALDKDFHSILYDSQKMKEKESAHIFLEEPVLVPLTQYYIRVMAWDQSGESTPWSSPASFVTGMLENSWQAEFVSAETSDDAEKSAGTYVRKEFALRGNISRAYACTTALGLYKFYLNGEKVGRDELTPGWTSYHKHLMYQIYDVTNYLKPGTNAAGAMIGAGWYKGLMGFLGRRNNYGTQTAFLGEIHIEYEDGTREVIATDSSWQGAASPVVFSEIYDGEIYDAGLEIPGWNKPGCKVGAWYPVQVVEYDKTVLEPQPGCRVQCMERLPAVRVFQTPRGETVVDFGQNLTGWADIEVTGDKKDVLAYHCFEVLDADGNVYTENLRKAKQQIQYTMKEAGTVKYHPNFTFQGFRYLCIDRYPGEIKKENFTACVIHSAMEQTGFFECSNADLNQLQHNILWGLKGNFLDVPTDCPQRNERVGWTGDAQIFCRTASFLENTYSFYSKWLKDVAADQTPEGGVPHVVPDIISGHEENDWLLSQGTHSAAAWADVAVIAPWTLYQVYGDKEILRNQYESMTKWIGFMEKHAKDYIWNYKLQFGDWVALDAAEGSYFGATPNDLTCTAYFAYSTGLMVKICKALDKKEDAVHFEELYRRIVNKYQDSFFDADGHLKAQTQTAQIVTLYFGLAPKQYRKNVISDLLRLLEKENGHLVTGFVGTPYFCHALSQNGCLDEAYDLLLKDDFPSWLYQVKMGATTVWEHWDGIRPDGTMWSPDMNSFNHYAYGAVGDWMYRVIAGIEIDEEHPGYKNILIQPHIGGNLDFAKGVFESVYGTITSYWTVEGKQGVLEIEIPANTTADILLEQADKIVDADRILFAQTDRGMEGHIGSGRYKIKFTSL